MHSGESAQRPNSVILSERSESKDLLTYRYICGKIGAKILRLRALPFAQDDKSGGAVLAFKPQKSQHSIRRSDYECAEDKHNPRLPCPARDGGAVSLLTEGAYEFAETLQ